MLHVPAPLLPSPLPISLCQDVWFRAEKGREDKRSKKEISTKLDRWIETKKKCLSCAYFRLLFRQSFHNKRFSPTSVFFIIIYLKCQYGTELNSMAACASLCLSRCKSSTPKRVRSEVMWMSRDTTLMLYANLNDLGICRWRQTKGISTQDGIVGLSQSLKCKLLCLYQTSRTQQES